VIIINNSKGTKYTTLAHRDLMPGARSADIDAAGLAKALKSVVSSCGNLFSIRLNDAERDLVDKLLALDELGHRTRIVDRPRPRNPFEDILRRDEEEKAKRMASIKAAQAKEASIRDEANYTSKKDVEEARAKSMSIKGDVEAKKLNTKMSGEVSLKDLMGDNKFIEESMKHSGVSTVVASEEGWDMEKMNAPKVKDTAKAPEPVQEAEPEAAPAAEPEKPAKKSRRRSKKENA